MTKRSLNRIFHPIGQGAFYSERHDHFNIVYDCGVEWKESKSKRVENLVKYSFAANEVIDVLFISHFDFDHVCKIPTLKKNFKIKNVVLPLLHNEEKIILVEVFKYMGVVEDLISIIETPDTYFENSRVIEVGIMEEGDQVDNNSIVTLNDDDTTLAESSDRAIEKVKSGTIIKNDFWEYIPFNIFNEERSSQFKSILEKNGFSVKDMKDKFDYSDGTRKKIQNLYKKVNGDINQNSMIVYSGPANSTATIEDHYTSNEMFFEMLLQPVFPTKKYVFSCLYTGDSDMNMYNIKLLLPKRWHLINTFQIPHHGDLKSFDSKQLQSKKYICPISFGEKNSYGHPSNKVVSELYKDSHFVKFVTENAASLFVERIRYTG